MKTQDSEYHLHPCCGIEDLGIPFGHIYAVVKNDVTIRYMSKFEAWKIYPEEDMPIHLSEEKICPFCDLKIIPKKNWD